MPIITLEGRQKRHLRKKLASMAVTLKQTMENLDGQMEMEEEQCQRQT
jgi:hypothetical protein